MYRPSPMVSPRRRHSEIKFRAWRAGAWSSRSQRTRTTRSSRYAPSGRALRVGARRPEPGVRRRADPPITFVQLVPQPRRRKSIRGSRAGGRDDPKARGTSKARTRPVPGLPIGHPAACLPRPGRVSGRGVADAERSQRPERRILGMCFAIVAGCGGDPSFYPVFADWYCGGRATQKTRRARALG